MSRAVGLDLGDAWIGVALSDGNKIIAQPYITIKKDELDTFLTELLKKEQIDIIVIGYPKTLKGTISEQTKKIIQEKEKLEEKFTQVQWILWDERLSSKRASSLKVGKKDNKHLSHAIAAAFILDSYIQYLYVQNL